MDWLIFFSGLPLPLHLFCRHCSKHWRIARGQFFDTLLLATAQLSNDHGWPTCTDDQLTTISGDLPANGRPSISPLLCVISWVPAYWSRESSSDDAAVKAFCGGDREKGRRKGHWRYITVTGYCHCGRQTPFGCYRGIVHVPWLGSGDAVKRA